MILYNRHMRRHLNLCALLLAAGLLPPMSVGALGDEANKQCLETWKYGPQQPRHRCEDKTNGATTRGYCAGPHDCVLDEKQKVTPPDSSQANVSSPSAGSAAAPLPNNSRAMLPWNDPRALPTPSEIEAYNQRRTPSFTPENPGAWEQFKQVPEVPKGAASIPQASDVPLPREAPSATERTAPNTGFSYAGESAEDRAFSPSAYQRVKDAAVRFGSKVLGISKYATGVGTFFGTLFHSDPAY